MKSWEVNIDGLVGPTHNYSGLSFGNIASELSRNQPSNPKAAALQGLKKMKRLHDLGVKQALLPPQERPHLPTLRFLGFIGSDEEVLRQAYKQSPELFFACSSASSMWMANAATISPSADGIDGRVQFLPANLSSKFHRSIEHSMTARLFKHIFANPLHFVHHPILPSGNTFTDEGAANHTRFCHPKGGPGIQLFVYGKEQLSTHKQKLPAHYPARQTLEASQTVARLHHLSERRAIFAQQSPEAIDAGVFHNDVISVGHHNLFLYHEKAFVDTARVVEEISQKMLSECHIKPIFIQVSSERIPLETAVETYLFNSQIVTLPNGAWHLLAPQEAHDHPSVSQFISEVIEDNSNPIQSVDYIDLRESMHNGGGPACLRLRVVLNETELTAARSSIFLTDELYDQLTQWVNKHYRDILLPEDLVDPQFYHNNQRALDELSKLLQLGSIYSFQ